ncbi:O-methyltransferase [Alkalicoccus halolimnae]|uniref:tRNA 5-hydroxyuridine methyltransferase n=1 Tax=Alkalicoccus halolimnae TaxID=1667239 RepID=A0A5C7F721_9BACI|nr:O-methyltransferase [Alkalicoccus halolimnae]TXF86492.1 O-methyltransferase [Alkalicoccus halolimnae]
METGRKTSEYIASFIPQSSGIIKEMEDYASIYNIPIMDKEGMAALLQLLKIQHPQKILEIGTAIGYSGIRILQENPGSELVSIEREAERADKAEHFISQAQLKDRFKLIRGDALEEMDLAAENGPFDSLFIDAAKGQYEKFFQFYEPMVRPGGVIYSDNVLFKGYVTGESEPESKRMKALAKRIRSFNETIMKDANFHSYLFPAGDGLLVSKKIK